MRLQKLVVMTALAAAIGSANVSALGLGEVKLYSSLNQPLKAEIELLQVQDLNRTEILPNLASRSDFERAGVDRPFALTDLSFKTVIEASGKAVIQVTSTKPVQEPYLNFLMELHWPSGRLLREYTLLLDPPAFSEQTPAPVEAPAIPDYEPYIVENEVPAGTGYLPVPKDAPIASVPQVVTRLSPDGSRASSRESLNTGDSYQVQRNDTLWEIALQVRPGNDLTVQQTMLAIQRDNPQAFMDNNINRLKSGEVLRIPDRRAIARMTPREAISSVARQNRDWYESQEQRVAQLDATRRTSARSGSRSSGPDGQLNIVAADSTSGQGQDLGGDNSASNAAIQTELAMTREQLDKLTRENTELKSRLKDLDDQIATLKRLATLKDDQMAALQTQIARAGQEQQDAAVQARSSSDQGIIGMLFSNPLLLILLAIFPLGLVGWLLYRRRKEQQAMDMDDDDDESSDPVVLTPAPEKKESEPEETELDFDQSLEIDESLLVQESSEDETAQETEDAISEADIYIAYGRFNQAADLLRQAIEAEPQRSDLRLKLLEVHAENTDLDGFREALAGLENLGDAEALRKAEVYKTRFPGESFGGTTEGNQAIDDLAELELDLDEDDDLDLSDDQSPAPPPPLEDDLDLGDLDLDGEGEAGDELPDIDLDDFDLDLDDEPADPVAADTSAAFSEEGETALDAAINEDDLDFLSEDDEVATKLDLARAYMDMGDMDGARDILQEVMEQGSDEQKAEAQSLLDQAG